MRQEIERGIQAINRGNLSPKIIASLLKTLKASQGGESSAAIATLLFNAAKENNTLSKRLKKQIEQTLDELGFNFANEEIVTIGVDGEKSHLNKKEYRLNLIAETEKGLKLLANNTINLDDRANEYRLILRLKKNLTSIEKEGMQAILDFLANDDNIDSEDIYNKITTLKDLAKKYTILQINNHIQDKVFEYKLFYLQTIQKDQPYIGKIKKELLYGSADNGGESEQLIGYIKKVILPQIFITWHTMNDGEKDYLLNTRVTLWNNLFSNMTSIAVTVGIFMFGGVNKIEIESIRYSLNEKDKGIIKNTLDNLSKEFDQNFQKATSPQLIE